MCVSEGRAFPVEGTARAKGLEWDPGDQYDGWNEVRKGMGDKGGGHKCHRTHILSGLQATIKTLAFTLSDVE